VEAHRLRRIGGLTDNIDREIVLGRLARWVGNRIGNAGRARSRVGGSQELLTNDDLPGSDGALDLVDGRRRPRIDWLLAAADGDGGELQERFACQRKYRRGSQSSGEGVKRRVEALVITEQSDLGGRVSRGIRIVHRDVAWDPK